MFGPCFVIPYNTLLESVICFPKIADVLLFTSLVNVMDLFLKFQAIVNDIQVWRLIT